VQPPRPRLRTAAAAAPHGLQASRSAAARPARPPSGGARSRRVRLRTSVRPTRKPWGARAGQPSWSLGVWCISAPKRGRFTEGSRSRAVASEMERLAKRSQAAVALPTCFRGRSICDRLPAVATARLWPGAHYRGSSHHDRRAQLFRALRHGARRSQDPLTHTELCRRHSDTDPDAAGRPLADGGAFGQLLSGPREAPSDLKAP
jgi:hypothetical protein